MESAKTTRTERRKRTGTMLQRKGFGRSPTRPRVRPRRGRASRRRRSSYLYPLPLLRLRGRYALGRRDARKAAHSSRRSLRIVRPPVRHPLPQLNSERSLMKVSHTVALFVLLFGLPGMPQIKLPTVPLHTEYLVEVNKKGQVVKSKPSKLSKLETFNLMTYGNTLQMWMRKRDNTATVGLFRVTFDYDPKTKKVARTVTLVTPGGSWAAQEGAATAMYEDAVKQL